MRVSLELKRQIVETIRRAHQDALQETLPKCLEVPPEQWTKEESAQYDLLVDAERKATAAVESLLA